MNTAPNMKSLLIFLATATLIYGEKTKSEKRGIADSSNVFSSSRLQGTGIRINTNFGKEMTLEEYKTNGYSFGNSPNNQFLLTNDINLNKLNLYKNYEAQNAQQNNENQQYLFPMQQNNENQQYLLPMQQNNENQQYLVATQQNNENGQVQIADSNSQNVPQQYQIVINRDSNYPLPHHIQVLVPVQQQQQQQRQPEASNEAKQDQKTQQINSHESEATMNNDFIPSKFYAPQKLQPVAPESLQQQYSNLQQKYNLKSQNTYPQYYEPSQNKAQYNIPRPSGTQHGFQFSLAHVVKPAHSSQYFYSSFPSKSDDGQLNGSTKMFVVKSGPVRVADQQ